MDDNFQLLACLGTDPNRAVPKRRRYDIAEIYLIFRDKLLSVCVGAVSGIIGDVSENTLCAPESQLVLARRSHEISVELI